MERYCKKFGIFLGMGIHVRKYSNAKQKISSALQKIKSQRISIKSQVVIKRGFHMNLFHKLASNFHDLLHKMLINTKYT